MNVIHSGDKWQIYGAALETYQELPVGTYTVNFHPMQGFYITTRADLSANEEKIYGSIPIKVKKVLHSYKLMQRNFGVLLSGKKGIGKSLFVRVLADEGYKENLPVIVVDSYIPGIANFLSSIEQDVIIVFDEFEKTFARTEDCTPQDEMLSLFDGLDGGHKLFVVTCNDLYKLSDYMQNRPGRFHYHIELGAPSAEEVREYLNDKLEPQYTSAIDDVVALSGAVDMPYDYLRAIAFELNQGYTFKEAMSDLNIRRDNYMYFNITAYRKDGTVWQALNQMIDLTSDESEGFYVYKIGSMTNRRYVWFDPSKMVLIGGEYIVNESIQMRLAYSEEYSENGEAKAQAENENIFERIVLQKCEERNYRFV